MARSTSTVKSAPAEVKAEAPKKPVAGETPLSEIPTLTKVLDLLGLKLRETETTFKGFGKAIRAEGGATIYLNRGNADIRSTLKNVSEWAAQGHGVVRGQGQYLRVNLKG